VVNYETSLSWFKKAISIDFGNRTAHHRLGLINQNNREFQIAADHLQEAYQEDPGHRGVVKALGFTYVWLEQYDLAGDMLRQIPEAPEELTAYRWWWATQDRTDLAEHADDMLSRFEQFARPQQDTANQR
jgi:tetratricopeptide (TPR) repeat protein